MEKSWRIFFQGKDHFFEDKATAMEFKRVHGLKGFVIYSSTEYEKDLTD